MFKLKLLKHCQPISATDLFPESDSLGLLDFPPDDRVADDDDGEGDGVGDDHEIFLREGLSSGNHDEVAAAEVAVEAESAELERFVF